MAIAQGDVYPEVVVDLVEAGEERGPVVDTLGDQRRDVPCDALGHHPPDGVARAEGEQGGGGDADDEEHGDEVEVDARVEPGHVSPRAGARNPRRGSS